MANRQKYNPIGSRSFASGYMDEQDRHHARLDFHKAFSEGTDHALAEWARRYGEAMTNQLWEPKH